MTFNKDIAQAITTVMTTNFPKQLTRCLRRLIAFDNLIILAYHKNEQPDVLHKEYFDPIVYRAMDTQYLTGAYQLDPFYHEVLKGHAEGVKRLSDVVPQGFSSSEYYKDYYQQTTLVDELAIFSKVSPETTLTICLGNDRSSRTPLNPASIRQINDYAPIIAALAGKHWGRVSLSSQNEQSNFLSQKQLQFFLKTKKLT